jgi:hypothetical protein
MNLAQRIETNPNVRVAVIDPIGNALICYKDGKVMLTISTESRDRKIGFIKDKMGLTNEE